MEIVPPPLRLGCCRCPRGQHEIGDTVDGYDERLLGLLLCHIT